ncbi:MAG: response regulator [Acidobacteriota bacterium]
MTYKLLLADDSFTVQKIVTLTFSEIGFEVHVVRDGNFFIDTLREINPDVILLDINLPEKDGYELCEELNKSDDYSEIPIFLMKGAFDSPDEEKLKNLKYQEIISKPFDASSLAGKIKEILEEREKVELPSFLPEQNQLEKKEMINEIKGEAPEIPQKIAEEEKKEEGYPILSDELIERIIEKLVKKISPEVVKEVASKVIPEIAEIYIKQEIERVKEEVKSES